MIAVNSDMPYIPRLETLGREMRALNDSNYQKNKIRLNVVVHKSPTINFSETNCNLRRLTLILAYTYYH